MTQPNRDAITPMRDGVTVGVGGGIAAMLAELFAGPLVAWVEAAGIPGLDVVLFNVAFITLATGAFAYVANRMRTKLS